MTETSLDERIQAPTAPCQPPPAHAPDRPHRCRVEGAAPPGGIGVHISSAGPGVTMISLTGELDVATADAVATAVTGAAQTGERIVLDLNRVTFLAARGLGVILAAHTHARRHGGALSLIVDQSAPAAAALRFLPLVPAPRTYSTQAAALSAAFAFAGRT